MDSYLLMYQNCMRSLGVQLRSESFLFGGSVCHNIIHFIAQINPFHNGKGAYGCLTHYLFNTFYCKYTGSCSSVTGLYCV